MQRCQDTSHIAGCQAVEDHLAFPPRRHQLECPELAEVLAERALRQPDQFAELIDAQFLRQQPAEDQEALGVRHRRQQFCGFVGARFKFCDIHT
ncbi:MAG: hypothetical protein BGO81_03900 [Devosia sp. 66-22]|nr:MAG: hypothetical protein BGO81_03900 [Devosia sp. 66-22]